MVATSSDGRNWNMPEVVFPQWNDFSDPRNPIRSQLHQRMGFYVAPNDRLLVISHYGLWNNEKNDIFGGPGHVAREVHQDGSLGPIYFVRFGEGWNASKAPYPFFKDSPDKGFVQACDALLANPFVTDQWYELEKGYPAEAYIQIQGSKEKDTKSRHMRNRRKALSFFTRANGDVVGIWKNSWTSVSSDRGKTWSDPVHAPGIATTFAKIWGQRTSDGRYAIAYDPVNQPPGYRWPLAVITGDDGITFDNMLVVEGEVPLRRYTGLAKDNGPQYVRGIAEGNPQPPDGAMWLIYSMNKEDIWVSRIPVPIRGSVTQPVHDFFDNMTPGGVVTDWNVYSPRWAPVEVANFPSDHNRSLRLKDGDPYDYARAIRVFPSAAKGEIGFKVSPQQTDQELDVDLDDAHGNSAIRITLSPNGQVEIANGTQVEKAVSYAQDKWLQFKIEYDASAQKFSVAINGKQVLQNAAFAQPVQTLDRISFRTGPERHVRLDQSEGSKGGKGNYYVGHVDPQSDKPASKPATYYLDDVWSQNK